MWLVIVSGRSGSGKTIALHALEDVGFYCIDNLPLAFLPELAHHLGTEHKYVAVSIDARNLVEELKSFSDIIHELAKTSDSCQIIYLDANNEILLKRFSETRRKHPLSNNTVTLQEAIDKEYAILAPIAMHAEVTIDTSFMSTHALYKLISDRFKTDKTHALQLLIQSFGFKHGLPPDADFVFDVRCLQNPYWNSALRNLTGKDAPVIDYLEHFPEVAAMAADIAQFLDKWVPVFKQQNRSYLSVAVGCTGGQHRSVYLAEKLAAKFKALVRHRDLLER